MRIQHLKCCHTLGYALTILHANGAGPAARVSGVQGGLTPTMTPTSQDARHLIFGIPMSSSKVCGSIVTVCKYDHVYLLWVPLALCTSLALVAESGVNMTPKPLEMPAILAQQAAGLPYIP
jgi:hypothetical protein